MTPLPINPKVLILIDPVLAEPIAVSSNISPDLRVTVTADLSYFNKQSKGVSFNTLRPVNNNNQ